MPQKTLMQATKWVWAMKIINMNIYLKKIQYVFNKDNFHFKELDIGTLNHQHQLLTRPYPSPPPLWISERTYHTVLSSPCMAFQLVKVEPTRDNNGAFLHCHHWVYTNQLCLLHCLHCQGKGQIVAHHFITPLWEAAICTVLHRLGGKIMADSSHLWQKLFVKLPSGIILPSNGIITTRQNNSFWLLLASSTRPKSPTDTFSGPTVHYRCTTMLLLLCFSSVRLFLWISGHTSMSLRWLDQWPLSLSIFSQFVYHHMSADQDKIHVCRKLLGNKPISEIIEFRND